MKKVLQAYFSHLLVVGLWFFFFIMLGIIAFSGLLLKHWLWLFLPIIIAPFYEWYAHKYILHAKLSTRFKALRAFQIHLHHDHHRRPHELKYQFSPLLAVVLHLLQTYILFAILSFSLTTALVPFTSGILYYLFYEWMHLAHHTATYKPKTKAGELLKRAHMRHHFYNENYCWGITNHVGDLVLNTFKGRDEVKKSQTTHHISGYQ